MKESAALSLVVAFTAIALSFDKTLEKARKKEMVEAEAVRWVPAGEGISVVAEVDGAAHLLRILLPDVLR